MFSFIYFASFVDNFSFASVTLKIFFMKILIRIVSKFRF